MFKIQKLRKIRTDFETTPTTLTVSWKSVGESKSMLGKPLIISFTMPQTKRLLKSRSSINSHQNIAFTTPNSIKRL